MKVFNHELTISSVQPSKQDESSIIQQSLQRTADYPRKTTVSPHRERSPPQDSSASRNIFYQTGLPVQYTADRAKICAHLIRQKNSRNPQVFSDTLLAIQNKTLDSPSKPILIEDDATDEPERFDPPFIIPKKQAQFQKEMESLRKVSPLHAARMLSRRVFDEARQEYKQSERSLKKFRLSIEVMKEDAIQHFANNNAKSPREWRDNLIAFRIRRKIINREDKLTLKQKEELYNAATLSEEEMQSIEIVPKSPIEKFNQLNGSPKSTFGTQKDTVRVLSGQNSRFLASMGQTKQIEKAAARQNIGLLKTFSHINLGIETASSSSSVALKLVSESRTTTNLQQMQTESTRQTTNDGFLRTQTSLRSDPQTHQRKSSNIDFERNSSTSLQQQQFYSTNPYVLNFNRPQTTLGDSRPFSSNKHLFGKTKAMRAAEEGMKRDALRSSLKNWNQHKPPSTVKLHQQAQPKKRRIELAFSDSVEVNSYTPIEQSPHKYLEIDESTDMLA